MKLHLEYCKDIKLKYYIPKEINDFEDYKYNPLNKFYQDLCFPYNINNTDVILYDRKKEFNENNMALCESTCKFIEYKDHQIICECNIKTKFNSYLNQNSNKYNLISRFNFFSGSSNNIWVIYCFSSVLNKRNFWSNKCALIILVIIFLNITGAFLLKFIEYKYILNTSSHRIHYPWCEGVSKMSEKNKQGYNGDINTLEGYKPCGICNPK